MNSLEDNAAYHYVDHLDAWRKEIRRANRRRFYIETAGAITGAFFLIWAFSGCATQSAFSNRLVKVNSLYDAYENCK